MRREENFRGGNDHVPRNAPLPPSGLITRAPRRYWRRAPHGVLAVLGDGGYPYAVPLSFAYEDGHIYIHCARAGHKLDALRRCAKASFCAVERDDVVPEEFTTRYVSAIAFGQAP